MKHLKKFVAGTLAALGLATVMAVTATPAFATSITHGGVTCNQLSGSGLAPNIYYCLPTGTSQFQSGIANTQPNALSLLQPVAHFWEFNTIANFNSFCNNPTGPSLPCASVPAGSAGLTVGNNSMIFVVNSPFPYGAAAGGHEEGHQLDFHYNALLGIPASGSAQYLAKVNKDWTIFNALTACTTTATGAFDGRRDSHNVYICTGATGRGGSLISTYTGTGLGTNKAILQKAWPYYFFPGSASHPQCTTGAYCELWAEEQKFGLGNDDETLQSPSAVEFLKGGLFNCSQTFQSYLFIAGTLKANNTYPAACQ